MPDNKGYKLIFVTLCCALSFACQFEFRHPSLKKSIKQSENVLNLGEKPNPGLCDTIPSTLNCDSLPSTESVTIGQLCDTSLFTPTPGTRYQLEHTEQINATTCSTLDGKGITLIAPANSHHFNITGSATIQNITLA